MYEKNRLYTQGKPKIIQLGTEWAIKDFVEISTLETYANHKYKVVCRTSS
jgi:hypothetical protein